MANHKPVKSTHVWKRFPFSAKAKKRIARVTVARVNRGAK